MTSMNKASRRPWLSCLAFFSAVGASLPLGWVPAVLFGFVLGYCQEELWFDGISVFLAVFFSLLAPLAIFLVVLTAAFVFLRPARWTVFAVLPLFLLPFLVGDAGILPSGFSPWLEGLAFRARGLSLDDARRWAAERVSEYDEGTMTGLCPSTYWALNDVEFCPDQVPDFLVTPWARPPVVGITRRGYVDEPSVILSWYGHYLILGRLSKRLESAGDPVRRLADDAFLLYYNPK
jgi:hypothetical protein